MKVRTNLHAPGPATNWQDRRERKALNERFGPPRPGFDRAFAAPDSRTCHEDDVYASGEIAAPPKLPKLAGQNVGECKAGAAESRPEPRSPRLTNAEENARGRIGAARLHREEHEVWPYVVLILCCLVLVGLILWVGW